MMYPKVMMKRRWWMIGLLLLLSQCTALATWCLSSRPELRLWFWICIGVPIGFGLLILAILFVSEWRLKQRVDEAKGNICTSCGYDLRGAPDLQGKCPECGQNISPSPQDQWGRFLVTV